MTTMIEQVSETDNKLLNKIFNSDKHEIIKNYEINIAMFYKYGKRDKNGDLKSPAIAKYGKAIPAQIKLVSSFNRMTDNVDAKIILNKELWDEMEEKEKESTIDECLSYIQIKEDKTGEPIMISEDSNKVAIKLRHPDFYCEGFLDTLNEYKESYIPWQDANNISQKISH